MNEIASHRHEPAGNLVRSLAITARDDIVGGLLKPHVYGRLGWLDTKRRYRRTVLGPFWSAASLAISVTALGSIGVGLWRQPAADYIPFLAAGMIVWLLIQSVLTESCVTFTSNPTLFRQIRIEYSILAYALVWRSLLAFMHNMVVYLAVYLAFAPQRLGLIQLLILPGLAIVALNAAWIALLLGMVCLRFRDMQPLIANLTQITIFVTPIFWPPDVLQAASRVVFVTLNPVYHLIEVVRAPLIGTAPAFENYAAAITTALIGWTATYLVFQRYRKRIAFWS